MATVRQLNVNGRVYTAEVDSESSLLFVLRDHFDLTGSKYGCGEGQCGACTVLVDGKSRRFWITRVGDVGERQITTIEGLAQGDRLHPVQQAFLDEGAMQCAYYTSGMIMTAVSLLNAKGALSVAEIARSMEGNICRCGTQPRIVLAIERAAKVINQSNHEQGA
jgi:nicotinate dehydrogenase subunit A